VSLAWSVVMLCLPCPTGPGLSWPWAAALGLEIKLFNLILGARAASYGITQGMGGGPLTLAADPTASTMRVLGGQGPLH
jgi:hypothetical protein